jgi:hypothetical protein
MNPECQPTSCSERDSQRRRNLEWIFALEVWADNYTLIEIGAVVVSTATWVHRQCSVFAEHGVDLYARVGSGERFVAANDSGGGEHDEAEGDNDRELLASVSYLVHVMVVLISAHICPSTHHPGPVLIDLEQLDVDVSQCERHSSRDDQDANHDSRGEVASKGMREDDDSSSVGNQRQEHHSVAVETVEEHGLVSDHRGKLQDHQACCRQNRIQMQHHADLVWVLEIPVAFPWRSTGGAAVVWVAEDAVVGEVLKTG